MIELKQLQEITEENYLYFISRQYGNSSIPAFKTFLQTVRNIYENIEISKHRKITIFYTLKNTKIPLSKNFKISNLKNLLFFAKGKDIILDISNNSSIRIWNDEIFNINKIKKDSIIYQMHNGIETFYGKNTKKNLKKIESLESYFSPKTYKDLSEALTEYKITQVQTSPCKILEKIWYNKDNRIFLITKPESIIRDSLTQFLKIYLRGLKEVRPEQIVDESHPVDIKVTWSMTNKLALIEIKWMGKSVQKNKKIIKTAYSESRALQGAKQLADYLDANFSQSPTYITKGYLVILDARRRKINKYKSSINAIDGHYYEDREITFQPEYHKIRTDFEEPIRMFVKPVCTI